MKLFDIFRKKKQQKATFPPVPDWKPEIVQPLELVVDRLQYYTDGTKDFVVFKNGTIALIPDGLSDKDAEQLALSSLRKVFHAHPDMHPQEMDDGNILVGYNHNVANVVLSSVVEKHWKTIDRNHQNALATSEALITPLGTNVFNEFGKKSLFGRCFMFMDAQNPQVVQVVRKSV